MRVGRTFILDVLKQELSIDSNFPVFESAKKVRNQFVKQVTKGDIDNSLLHQRYLLSCSDMYGEYCLPVNQLMSESINILICPFESALTLNNLGIETFVFEISTALRKTNNVILTQTETTTDIYRFEGEYNLSKMIRNMIKLVAAIDKTKPTYKSSHNIDTQYSN
jgi:hypothetical protein